jgi:hypothetical protein
VQRESNVEVVRQMSQARLKREREAEAAAEAEAEGLKDESEGASGGTNGA